MRIGIYIERYSPTRGGRERSTAEQWIKEGKNAVKRIRRLRIAETVPG